MDISFPQSASILQELNDCPAIDVDRKLQMQYSIVTTKWKAYQDAVIGNLKRRVQIEHNTQILADLEAQLQADRLCLRQLSKSRANLEVQITKIQHIEELYQELRSTINHLENEIASARQNVKSVVDSAVEPARRVLQQMDQQFNEQSQKWEEHSLRETNRLRNMISQKRGDIGAKRAQVCLQHNKAKDELRRSFANQLKAFDVHVDCRSAELELKREIGRLQRRLGQVESPAKAKPTKPKKKPVVEVQASPRQNAEATHRKRKLFNISSNYLDF